MILAAVSTTETPQPPTAYFPSTTTDWYRKKLILAGVTLGATFLMGIVTALVVKRKRRKRVSDLVTSAAGSASESDTTTQNFPNLVSNG